MFNEDILEKNVSVSVQWNGQYDIDDPTDTYGRKPFSLLPIYFPSVAKYALAIQLNKIVAADLL